MSDTRRRMLAACPLFQDLADDRAALDDLALSCEEQRAVAGAVVITEGTEGDTMYIICSGRVRVEKRTFYDDAYTVTALSGSDHGFFGELALLDRERRSASVVAENGCEFVVVSREGFHAWGDRHPAAGLMVTRRIAQHLAGRLRRANADIVTLFSALVEEMEQRL
jgi:CRP/FNR family transcriptional regulator, cyclic AMP receptor protein